MLFVALSLLGALCNVLSLGMTPVKTPRSAVNMIDKSVVIKDKCVVPDVPAGKWRCMMGCHRVFAFLSMGADTK